MQTAVIECPETMTEKRVEILILDRLEKEQKDLAARVDNIDKSLQGVSREVSEIKGSLRPPVETPAWIRFFVYPSCVLIAAGMAAAVITLMVQMRGVQGFLRDNAGFIAGMRLERNSSNPRDAHNIADTKQLLVALKKHKLSIPGDLVKAAGTRFVEAAQNDSNAWSAALSLLDYRSLLNINLSPSTPSPKPGLPYVAKTQILTPNTETARETALSQTVSGYGTAPPSESARMEQLNNPASPSGLQYIIFEMPRPDNELILDGLYLKNVIVKDTRVAYFGGAAKVENVYFVNCTFDFPKPLQQAMDLANAIFQTPATTFVRAT